MACHTFEQHYSEAEKIGSAVHRVSHKLFWAHIEWSANHLAIFREFVLAVPGSYRYSEIDETRPPIWANENVDRLNITVDNAGFVDERQGVEQWQKECPDLCEI